LLVTTPQPDVSRLVKAVRKLRPQARVFGLCTPAGEYELHRAGRQGERVFDDYFIIPPTPREWQQILDAAGPDSPGAGSAAGAALSSRQLSRLIESTLSLDELADCVAGMAGQACGRQLRWARQGEGRAGVQQVLSLDDSPPRVLWAVDPLAPDDRLSQWLSALRAALPSLAAAARRTEVLRRMAITDHLTGAYNRRYFMHFAQRVLDAARAKQVRATLLLYDIDDFKTYNDEFGHAAGDEILRETARLMRQIVRKGDLVARIGGDEFAVLFSDLGPARQPGSQPPQTAYALVDRFRKAVNSHQFHALGPKASGALTISGGLAGFPWDGLTVADLLASADAALARAKADGKNNICIVGGGETSST